MDKFKDRETLAQGNWLIKTRLLIKDPAGEDILWGLFPKGFIAAYEIYWDGTKIAQNGVVGANKKDERPGLFHFDLPLPARLTTQGAHTLILRISNYRDYSGWKWFYGRLYICPYATELRQSFQQRYRAFFIAGLLFIPFLFNIENRHLWWWYVE